jgi:ATPase components of various ABC-type transport systems, contain duplicated ATPase
MSEGKNVIEVKNLRAVVHEEGQDITLLHDSSFVVREGECLGILGESGRGKSLCIAWAIACRSELILFDEAVSSLDAHTQVQIMDLLLDLKEKLGLTYIFITHDLTSITYFCSRVIFLKDGRVVADSPVSELSKLDVPHAKELLGVVLDFNAESA